MSSVTHAVRNALAPLRLLKSAARVAISLQRRGWLRSSLSGLPVNRSGEALPWLVYPFIDFIEPRIPANGLVFEYGMGNSSIWWAERTAEVHSVEHDPAWFRTMLGSLPPNTHAQLIPVDDNRYVTACADVGRAFDIVVMDGRRRVECCPHAIEALAPAGVIIWDNSERSEYAPAYVQLGERGFRRLDFTGYGPINGYEWSTSVFYRPKNVLGL
jgi:hypothetical protein